MSKPVVNDLLIQCQELFTSNVEFTDTLQCIALFAFIAAIVLLLIQAFLPASDTKVDGPPIRLLDPAQWPQAVGALATALTTAPGPVVLIALGLSLIWLPNVEPGESCKGIYEAQLQSKAAKAQLDMLKTSVPDATPNKIVTDATAKKMKTTVTWGE